MGIWNLFFYEKIYPKADKIIAVSDGIREFLIKKIHISADRIIKTSQSNRYKRYKGKEFRIIGYNIA